MKRWTTPGEFAWLSERIPDWRKLGGNKKRRKQWLASTVASFLEAFAPSGSARQKAPHVSYAVPILSFAQLINQAEG